MGLDVEELDPVEQNRERRILAAYLRNELGGSYEKVAEALGVSRGTVRRWTEREDWDEMSKIAHARWVRRARGKAQARLLAELEKDDADQKTLRFTLERLTPELAPVEDSPFDRSQLIVFGAAPAGVLRPGDDTDSDDPLEDLVVDADYTIEEDGGDGNGDRPTDD